MKTDRRSFLRLSALAGGALATGSLTARGLTAVAGRDPGIESSTPAPRTLDLLILGGTGFTGPHQVRYAVARGHRVTVFNRGQTQADLPDGVEQLQGDRNLGELGALKGRSWDAVIDNPTTLPFWVRDAGEVLRDATGHYVFISTISAFETRGSSPIDETSRTLSYADGDPLSVTPAMLQENGGLYGPMKAESEREATRWFGDRTTIIRPGLIVGPGDQSDRFTYWPVRIARGGEILAPGDGADPVQIIDARDLAEWTIRVVEDRSIGTFNAVGPRSRMTMAEQLHGIRGALSGDIDLRFTWAPADFLREHDVRPWMEMTTWFGENDLMSKVGHTNAIAAGLTFRPLASTTTDTLDWFRALPAERQAQPRTGLAPEKERAVLSAWHARATSGEAVQFRDSSVPQPDIANGQR